MMWNVVWSEGDSRESFALRTILMPEILTEAHYPEGIE
jgi:hypothetical protein